jgi:hypothetical protein
VQSLGDPLFVVPFAALLGVACVAALVAAAIHQRYGDEPRARHERLGYLAALGAVCSFIPFGISAAFQYAGTQARLVRGAAGPGEPTLVGTVGLALPWESGMWIAVIAMGACTVGGLVAVVVGRVREYGAVR